MTNDDLRVSSLLALATLALACAGDDGGTQGETAAMTGETGETSETGETGETGETTGATAMSTTAGTTASATSTTDATSTTSTTAATSATSSESTTSTTSTTTDAPSTGTTDAPPGYGCAQAPVFANDFDDDEVGAYADLDDWNTPPWDNGVDEGRVEIIDGPEAFSGRSLRVHYPEGGVGPSEGGAQWRLELDDSYDELYLAYRVRFADGFDFVLGGKLPGLVGGSAPTGCSNDQDGFSARSMWRPEGAGVQYMYFPEKQNNCGDDYDYMLGDAIASFEPGVWHTLEHHVVMNTPGEHDGLLQAWLDGELVLDAPGFLFRLADGTYSIDAMYFSTFFGGSSNDWAPTKDERVDFDDFVICDGPITH